MKSYKSSYYYKLLAEYFHKLTVIINPVREVRRVYYKVYHRYPNLEKPENLIEKIYWLQLNTDTSLWTRCADKYLMRGYVEECGFANYLPHNYGRWDKVKDIDFNLLPVEFVFKANNGCGTVMIVRDKKKLDKKKVQKQLQRWLDVPFGYRGAQLHYTKIKPCIIAEELLHQDDDLNSISPNSLIDFKVWCINGKPESIFVAYNRHDVSYINIALYDTEWNPIPQYLQDTKCDVYRPDVKIPKPTCLKEMFKIAMALSRPFPEVRIDFYIIENKPIIGELTFTTGYGYFTEDYYRYLGDKIDIKY